MATSKTIEERIRHLLDIASRESSNIHERNTALRRAESLMKQHSVDNLEQNEQKEIVDLRVEGFSTGWRLTIANWLTQLYGTYSCYVKGSHIRLFGTETDINVTLELLRYCTRSVENEAATLQGSNLRSRRAAFKNGAAAGIRDLVCSLKTQRQQTTGKELMVVNAWQQKREEAKAIATRDYALGKPKKRVATYRSQSDFENGRAYGKNLNLNTNVLTN